MRNRAPEIIEAYSVPKSGNPDTNEDGYFAGEHYIAVVDGTTSKDGRLIDGRSGGRLARDRILSVLSSAHGDESRSALLEKIQRTLVEELPVSEYGEASASAAIYSVAAGEIWYVGDCQIMVDGAAVDTAKPIDRILSDARALAAEGLLLQGTTTEELMNSDTAREMILPFLKLQHVFENQPGPYGYTVFNNTCTDYEQLSGLSGCVTVPANAEVILASDGYPVLRGTLDASEKELARVLEEDPLCFRQFKSTKGKAAGNVSFDDRTYVRFRAVR